LIVQDLPIQIDEVKYDAKVDLFMDIITEFRNLKNKAGLKPHEYVDIVIQSNTNFLEFVKKYENLIKKLINVDEVR